MVSNEYNRQCKGYTITGYRKGQTMTRAEKATLWRETYNTAEKMYRRHGYQKTREWLWTVPGISVSDARWMLEEIAEDAR